MSDHRAFTTKTKQKTAETGDSPDRSLTERMMEYTGGMLTVPLATVGTYLAYQKLVNRQDITAKENLMFAGALGGIAFGSSLVYDQMAPAILPYKHGKLVRFTHRFPEIATVALGGAVASMYLNADRGATSIREEVSRIGPLLAGSAMASQLIKETLWYKG